LDWLTHSPDINPKENTWALLKKQVAKRNPETIEDLENAIHLECQGFSSDVVSNTFSSIDNRIDLSIESNGRVISFNRYILLERI